MRRRFRRVKRVLRNNRVPLVVLVLLAVGVGIDAVSMQDRRLSVNPATYGPLLQVIARAESNDNYNAYFGYSGKAPVDLVAMPIAEVLKWQANYVAQGSPSSAVGRYQIIDSTLAGLVRQLGIDTTQKFDQAMQDRLAIALLERRGAENYINKELSAEQFAANLAKEWAGLPKVVGENPNESYYAGDGLNKSHVGVQEVMQAIIPIKPE